MGFFSDISDAFTGKAQRRDIQDAAARATGADQRALAASTATRNEASTLFDPERDAGQQALALLRQFTGVDGREAQTGAFDEFQTDPGVADLEAAGIRGIERSAASRGRLLSGENFNDVGGFSAQLRNQVFNQRLDRLTQLAGAGSNATVNKANIATGTADAQLGIGQRESNRIISEGNAVAQSRSVPINNLIEIAKAGGNFAKAAAGGGA